MQAFNSYACILILVACRFEVILFKPMIIPMDSSEDKIGVIDLVGKGVCNSYTVLPYSKIYFKKEYDIGTNSVPT